MLREVTGAERDVERLFNPSSVAVLGASSRPGTLSWWPLQLLRGNGYRGHVYPINPGRAEIDGLRCYGSLDELPGTPEVVIVALNAERSLEAVRQCAAAGVGAVVLPTQGFGEQGEDGRRRERELAELCGAGRLRIVGTNTDGIGNLETGAIASIQPLFAEGIEPGPVAIATQSGATAASLMVRLKREGIGCRLYASAGNETDLGYADYLSVMVQHPEVRMVLSFVEAIRRPDDFIEVATLAAELGKPIALIKVGRSDQGARRAAAHTGALAGQDAVYDAVFRELGVIRVDELSELVGVARLFLTRGAPRGRGVGVMSVSGGQAGAVADTFIQRGVGVPAVSPETEARLDAELEFGTGFNPCDLTGAVATDHGLAARVFSAFAEEPAVDAIVYARKHLTGDAGTNAAARLAEAAAAAPDTPLAVYAMDGAVAGEEAETYRAHEIPVFASVSELATALGALATWRARPGRPGIVRGEPRGPLGAGGVLGDDAARDLARAYGLPLARETGVGPDADEAVRAAEAIGFPVVLKVADRRIAHKTEAGGVAVGLADAGAVRDAAARILAGARAYLGDGTGAEGLLVQEQVEGGHELILGAKVEPAFGPVVLAGMGGVLTEVLSDVALRRAPVDAPAALEMLGELRGHRLLTGFRGAPPADLDAAAEAIAALSRLAWDHRAHLREVDLNPLVVLPAGRGARVVDVLVVEDEADER